MASRHGPDRQTIPVIKPPAAPPSSAGTSGLGLGTTPILIIASFAILVCLALAVFFVLPDFVNAPETPTERTETQAVLEATPASTAEEADEEEAQLKVAAQAALGLVLRERTRLEVDRAPVWAPETYQAIQEAITKADQQFASGRLAEALESYEEALRRMSKLSASKSDRLQAALKSGAEAFAAADGTRARAEFRIALAIEPDNREALQGGARAEALEQTTNLLEQGLALEKQERFEQAANKLAQLLVLDPLFEEAEIALRRVERSERDGRFQHAMSQGLAQLDGGNLLAARESLQRARTLGPDAPELRSALARLTAAEQDAELLHHRRRAEDLETQERWQEAAQAYSDALQIDPNVSFGLAGKARASTMVDLYKRIDVYLTDPQRLHSAATLAEAKLLLALAADARSGPKLLQKRSRLSQLLESAQTPVEVLLRSDALTEVIVQRVGRMGRFSERVLELKPGRYTALGTRLGYRDVRVEFSVGAGVAPPAVTVRCEEPV